MSSRPAIVHLIGFPGAGKYTIARALAARRPQGQDRFVVVDNHHINNTVFAVMDVDGVRVLPDEVWDRVSEVRAAVLRTIEQFSPPRWSFVFTNVLIDGDEVDAAMVDRLMDLAARRQSRYVPIRVLCERAELLRRVGHASRRDRMKWTDPDGVGHFVASRDVLRPNHPDGFDLDVTDLSPEHAAGMILERLDRLG